MVFNVFLQSGMPLPSIVFSKCGRSTNEERGRTKNTWRTDWRWDWSWRIHSYTIQPASQSANQPTDQLADLDKSRQQLKLFTQSNKALCIVSIVLSLVDDLRSIWSCGSHIFNTSSLLSRATSLSLSFFQQFATVNVSSGVLNLCLMTSLLHSRLFR